MNDNNTDRSAFGDRVVMNKTIYFAAYCFEELT